MEKLSHLTLRLHLLLHQARLKRRDVHPCADYFDKVANALEMNKYDVRAAAVHVKAMDKCLEDLKKNRKTSERKATMYQLNKYLDQQKHKIK